MKRAGVTRKNVLPFIVASLLAQGLAFAGTSGFDPTIANTDHPPGKAPEGMVWIPGGEFSMGAAMAGQGSAEMPMASNDSGPVHRVRVDGFWMDATPITNQKFEKFVKATGYITIAERTPTKEEFPLRLKRILLPARSCSRRLITRYNSTIITSGGV